MRWAQRRAAPQAQAGARAGAGTARTLRLRGRATQRHPPSGLAIRFLLGQEPLSPPVLRAAFARARVPDVPEIRELFLSAQPKVLALAGEK